MKNKLRYTHKSYFELLDFKHKILYRNDNQWNGERFRKFHEKWINEQELPGWYYKDTFIGILEYEK